MQKVYTRKRSKSIKNPFQSNNDSFIYNPKVALPLFSLVSVIFTFLIIRSVVDVNVNQDGGINNDDVDDMSSRIQQQQVRPVKTSLFHKLRRNDQQRQQQVNIKPYEFPLSSFQNHIDGNLKTMTFTLPTFGATGRDEIEQSFQAYVQPHISTFYNKNDPSMNQVHPNFHGEAGKFFNLSNKHLALHWSNGQTKMFMFDVMPFQAVGTATFPGHIFILTPKEEPDTILHEFHVVRDQSLYVYDPYYDDESNRVNIEMVESDFNKRESEQYWLQRNSLEFGKIYHQFTGRQWLSLFPLRKPPIYRMWNADYFGQEHWVMTKETHYITEPPEPLLGSLSHDELHSEVLDRNRHLSTYRQGENMNMTLKVLSCAPRVFEIRNFLSHVEVDHIVHMATGMKLSLSTTSGADGLDRREDTKTRTSKNSWVGRTKSPIMDSIYRRAADLMQIDEALLRRRDVNERPDIDHVGTNAEDLQLVHYDVNEQYTAHHDFSYPLIQKAPQPARFATLLLYLNEGMEGGETSFPRWVNAETSRKLSVVPEVGKAVLFYSILPDGNMDDLSQHAVSWSFKSIISPYHYKK